MADFQPNHTHVHAYLHLHTITIATFKYILDIIFADFRGIYFQISTQSFNSHTACNEPDISSSAVNLNTPISCYY